MNVVLRSTESKTINIPSKIWKRAGWNLNDKVTLTVCETLVGSGKSDDPHASWKSISLERTDDLEKYDDDYKDGEWKETK